MPGKGVKRWNMDDKGLEQLSITPDNDLLVVLQCSVHDDDGDDDNDGDDDDGDDDDDDGDDDDDDDDDDDGLFYSLGVINVTESTWASTIRVSSKVKFLLSAVRSAKSELYYFVRWKLFWWKIQDWDIIEGRREFHTDVRSWDVCIHSRKTMGSISSTTQWWRRIICRWLWRW